MSPKNLTSKNPFFLLKKPEISRKWNFKIFLFFRFSTFFFEKENSKEADQKT